MSSSNDFFLTDATLYASHTDYEDMIEQIHNYVTTYGPVRCVLFVSEKDAYEHFEEGAIGEFRVERQYFHDGIYIGQLSREYGRKRQKTIRGRFLLFKHRERNIYIILTNERRSFFEQGLLKYIRNKYPIFALPFFYSWEMEEMLNSLAYSTPQSAIMLTKLSRKSRITSIASRKKKESDLTWTDLPYKEVFRQTRQSDAWMERVWFDLVEETAISKRKVFGGSISRNGVFKCELQFKLFHETILEKSIRIFSKRRDQLSNRARTENTNYQIKPLFIEFDEPILRDKEQNHRLVSVLRKLPHLAYSVVHENPYLHMTVTDYIDNSNYEIWILSDSRITIAPQTVSSMSSLNRLCDHISREFKEGLLKDLKETV